MPPAVTAWHNSRSRFGSPETTVSNNLSAPEGVDYKRRLRANVAPKSTHPTINRSIDRHLNRLADTAEHFHERIDGELSRFFVHDVGHPRARNHQNLGGLGLL